MGGPGSGITRKRRQLPKTLTTGGLARADRRAAEVRAVLDGAAAILEDHGGADNASFLRVRMAHRVMHLDALLNRDEFALAQGRDIDRANYLNAAQTWLRYAQALGLSRVAKPVESLHSYMRRKSAPATVDASPSHSASAGPSSAADLSTGATENQ